MTTLVSGTYQVPLPENLSGEISKYFKTSRGREGNNDRTYKGARRIALRALTLSAIMPIPEISNYLTFAVTSGSREDIKLFKSVKTEYRSFLNAS